MRAGQRPPAGPRVGVQPRPRHRRQVDRRLPVPELADVEVVLPAVEALAALPAEEDVARRVRDPLAADDALAVVLELARAQVRLEHRRLRLLRLQDERVLARRGRRAGIPTRACRRCRRRRPCGPCRRTGRCRRGSAGRGRGRRRTGPAARGRTSASSRASAGSKSSRKGTSSGGTLRKRSSPSTRSVSFLTARRLVLRRALANGFANTIRPLAPSLPPKRSTSSLAVRRSYQTSRWLSSANAAHPLPVLPHAGRHDPPPPIGREPDVAAGDLGAGRHPLDVPLPRAGQRLVEVVGAEDEPAVRRREAAEVRDVGVAARLHRDPRVRRRREVGRHHGRRAAVEGERRHEHPPVADRDQLLHPRGRLGRRAPRRGRAGPAPAPTRRGPTGARSAAPRDRARRTRRAAAAARGTRGRGTGRRAGTATSSRARGRDPSPRRGDAYLDVRGAPVFARTSAAGDCAVVLPALGEGSDDGALGPGGRPRTDACPGARRGAGGPRRRRRHRAPPRPTASPRPGAAGVGDPSLPRPGQRRLRRAPLRAGPRLPERRPEPRPCPDASGSTPRATQALSRFDLDFSGAVGALGPRRRPPGVVRPVRRGARRHAEAPDPRATAASSRERAPSRGTSTLRRPPFAPSARPRRPAERGAPDLPEQRRALRPGALHDPRARRPPARRSWPTASSPSAARRAAGPPGATRMREPMATELIQLAFGALTVGTAGRSAACTCATSSPPRGLRARAGARARAPTTCASWSARSAATRSGPTGRSRSTRRSRSRSRRRPSRSSRRPGSRRSPAPCSATRAGTSRSWSTSWPTSGSATR